MNKKLLRFSLAIVGILFCLTSCQKEPQPSSDSDPSTDMYTYLNITPLVYEDLSIQTDMDAFFMQTKKSDGYSWDGPLSYGMVPSVWHKLKINNVDVPVYSARCGFDIHSFAYVDVDTDGPLDLSVQVELTNISHRKSIILPEKRNQTVTIKEKYFFFKILEYGDSTICFGDDIIESQHALTIFVKKPTSFEVPSNYKTVMLNPGTYLSEDNNYESLRRLRAYNYYYFKKGKYILDSILIPNNCILYFEPGVYLEFQDLYNTNCIECVQLGGALKIYGHALCDFSKLQGGLEHTKIPFNFVDLGSAYIEGFININSNCWTMCFANCSNLDIRDNLLLGYRTGSDGIMLTGCDNSVVHHNFVRTGDDAIEVKGASYKVIEKNNLVFEYNTVWADKANCYGVIYESTCSVNGVVFRHNSIGFAMSSWTDYLGCFIVYMGTDYHSTFSDIHFEDSEVYCCYNTLLNITLTTINPYSYGDPTAADYGGCIKDIYMKNVTIKRHEVATSNIYSLRICAKENPNNPDSLSHMSLGSFYLDNVNYLGTKLTESNFLDTSYISVPPALEWNISRIHFNTLDNKKPTE